MMTKKKAILLSVLILGVITPLLALGISFMVARIVADKDSGESYAPEASGPETGQEILAPDAADNTDIPPKNAPRTAEVSGARDPRPGNTPTPSPAMSARVIAGETAASLQFSSGTTLYDALVQARNEGKIGFSGKNYTGMGFFVTDIGTLHSGDGLDLLYYINGTEATVGVSSYVLRDGDVIEWKLE